MPLLLSDFSELGGEGLVALTTDRLGKPRALMLGLTGNILASLLLPIVGRTQIGALVGLFLFYITFEYVLVSHIPLMTEVMPGVRATLLSFNVMGHSVGRMIGALVATFTYERFGFLPVTIIAILFNVFALLALGELTQKIVLIPRSLPGSLDQKEAKCDHSAGFRAKSSRFCSGSVMDSVPAFIWTSSGSDET